MLLMNRMPNYSKIKKITIHNKTYFKINKNNYTNKKTYKKNGQKLKITITIIKLRNSIKCYYN